MLRAGTTTGIALSLPRRVADYMSVLGCRCAEGWWQLRREGERPASPRSLSNLLRAETLPICFSPAATRFSGLNASVNRLKFLYSRRSLLPSGMRGPWPCGAVHSVVSCARSASASCNSL